jgi:plasminogen activator inhibitor 1 RNA-binding protein
VLFRSRNTKGGRGPRVARDGKRTYDRRSGTGRGKEIKKGGGGGRNWGSDKNEARKNEGPVDESAPVVPAEEAEVTENEPIAEEPVVVEQQEEEEDKTMTMEEYLALKAGKVAGENLFGSKKEKTIEDNEFAGKEAHVVVEEDFLVMGTGKKTRKRVNKKEVQKLDVNFRVASSNGPRPRRDDDKRGEGRGGGRGDRRRGDRRGGGRGEGRGRGRGGRNSGGRGGIRVDDVNAFPSL